MIRAFTLLFILLSAPAVQGDDGVDLPPLEVHGARAPLLESFTSVTVVQPRDEDLRAGRSLADLVESVPGVQVMRGSTGGRGKITIRGAGARQVAVMVEGVPMTDPRTGEVDLSVVPLDAVEAVEVYRGGRGAAAGSGAIGGVVVVRLKKGRRTELRQRLSTGFYGAGDWDNWSGDFGLRHRSLSLAYAHQESQGAFPFIDTNGNARVRENNASRTDRLNLAWRPRLRGKTRVELTGTGSLGHRGAPGMEQFPGGTAWESDRTWLTGVRLRWPGLAGRRLRLTARGSHGFWQWRFVDPQSFLGLIVDTRSTSHRAQAGLDGRLRILPWLQLGLGLEGTGEWVEQQRLDSTDRTEGRGLMDANGSLRLGGAGPWQLLAACRLALSREGGATPVPSMELRWRTGPLTLAAAGSRAWRLPSFDELYFESKGVRGNPDLVPEDAWGGDLSASLRLGSFRLDLSGFYQRITNEILFLQVSPYLIEAQNSKQVNAWGTEAAASLGLGPVTLGGHLAWLDARFDDSGNRLPLKSPWTGGLEARLQLWRFQVYSTARYRSSFYLDRFESRSEEGRVTVDVGASADLGAGFRFAADVRNILDKRDALDHFQEPLPGLAWYVSLSHHWQGGSE